MGRGWKRILQDVPALRTDGQGPAGGPQGEPLEHQDQAPVLAEPVQRHLHLGRARPQRAPARLDPCAEERRPQWRPRCLPAQAESRPALAPRAGIEARDREEEGGRGAGSEGGLRFRRGFRSRAGAETSVLRVWNGRVERPGRFCYEMEIYETFGKRVSASVTPPDFSWESTTLACSFQPQFPRSEHSSS